MSETSRSFPGPVDSVIAWMQTSDLRMIVGTMVGIYLLFTVFSLLLVPLNQLVGGLVNTFQRVTFLTAVYALMVLALNLHWGYTGLFNIGVAGFMAVGVYTMAILAAPPTASPPGLGVPLAVASLFPVAPGVGHFLGLLLTVILGMLAAAVVGALTAIPAFRLRADYLAIVTIALSEIIRLSLLSRTLQTFTVPVIGLELGTGAGRGIGLPTNPVRAIFYNNPTDTAAGVTPIGEVLFGIADVIGVGDSVVVSWTYTLFLIGVVIAVYWLLVRIGNSPFGRVLKAIREDEEVAQSLGKNTRLVKVKVFMVGCALMGLAGILWEGSKGFTDPTSTTFLPLQTFYIFIALIIGGSGSNTGSVLGGALFAGLLFEGPLFVTRIFREYLVVGAIPGTFAAALGELFALDPLPLVAYAINNISPLRFVLIGILLIVLMQRRPEGLLGHRDETAASIDLSHRQRPAAEQGDDNE
ncbi:MAG: branched-chain amino acid ABC transporter permease [Halobacteriales archaeon]|nr:branched-chain amino acid ABC transporter permease [Halobacteriales archaeon]